MEIIGGWELLVDGNYLIWQMLFGGREVLVISEILDCLNFNESLQ